MVPAFFGIFSSHRSRGGVAFSASSVVWVSMAQSTAFTTLTKAANTLSPAELTKRLRSCSVSESN